MKAPEVSVIIPSLDGYRDGNVPRLVNQIKEQTFKDTEIIIIKGVRPNGKARNIGAEKAKGQILICIDDDVTIGHNHIIENLVKYIKSDKNIGLLGISKLIPDDSNWFQRRCAKEIPRSTSPIYDQLTEGDLVDHTCIAIRKDLYFELGMENENLIRGTDPDLRHRLRSSGYKIAIIPNAWGYHPMPNNLRKLLTMFFRNGMGSFWVQKHYPELALNDSDDHATPFKEQTSLPYRTRSSLLNMFKDFFRCHWIYFAARASYSLGFVYAIFSGKSGDPWYDREWGNNSL